MTAVGEKHLTIEKLLAGLELIRQSPKETGLLELIVRRPQEGLREVLDEAIIDLGEGLVGDNWRARGSTQTPDGAAHPEMQLTIMNARTIALIAQEKVLWPSAGDQLIIDMDLSGENLPPGTQLAIGSAVIAVTAQPHTGCKKFMARFGADALEFVSSPAGRQLNLRGVNAKVIQPGKIRVGDAVKKMQLNRT